jgi:hypothetical protein
MNPFSVMGQVAQPWSAFWANRSAASSCWAWSRSPNVRSTLTSSSEAVILQCPGVGD